MSKRGSPIVVIGSAHIDVLATVTGFADTLDRVGRMTFAYGGTAYNIATALAAADVPVRFVSALRDGVFAHLIIDDMRSRGIETDVCYRQELPEAGFCAHIVDGDLQSAVSATPLDRVALEPDRIQKALAGASAVVMDSNNSEITMATVATCTEKQGIPLFIAAVSESKALKVTKLGHPCAAIFLNRRELYYLRQHLYTSETDYREIARSLKTTLVVTRDTDGVAIITASDILMIPSSLQAYQGHLLGAGDAVLAGTVRRVVIGKATLASATHAAMADSIRIADSETCNLSPPSSWEEGSRTLSLNSRKDRITQVLSRAALEEEMHLALMETTWDHKPLTVFFIDVDHFKSFNDTRGHAFGDRVLAAIAKAIGNRLPQGTPLGRWGGDEFVGLLRGHTLEQNHALTHALATQFTSVMVDGQPTPVTLSIGIADYKSGAGSFHSATTTATLVADADRCLYEGRAQKTRTARLAVASRGL